MYIYIYICIYIYIDVTRTYIASPPSPKKEMWYMHVGDVFMRLNITTVPRPNSQSYYARPNARARALNQQNATGRRKTDPATQVIPRPAKSTTATRRTNVCATKSPAPPKILHYEATTHDAHHGRSWSRRTRCQNAIGVTSRSGDRTYILIIPTPHNVYWLAARQLLCQGRWVGDPHAYIRMPLGGI